MRHTDDNVLEAIWVVSETGDSGLDAVRRRCREEFDGDVLQRLEEDGLVIRCGNEVAITERGKPRALTLIRCHRLAEALFFTIFDLDWEVREAMACEVEHTLVPELAEGICTMLGHPTECPSGKQIPPGLCCVSHRQMIRRQVVPLSELEPGRTARILFIKSHNVTRHQQLCTAGLAPGVVLTLFQRSPAYRIQYDGTELALDRAVAKDVFVCPINGDNHAALDAEMDHLRDRRSLLLRRSTGTH